MKKINYRLDEEKLPSYSIIKAATEGNVDAINLILKHYERYILKLSTRMIYDKLGVDEKNIVSTGNAIKSTYYSFTVLSWTKGKEYPGYALPEGKNLADYPGAVLDEQGNITNDFSYVVVNLSVKNQSSKTIENDLIWGYIRLRFLSAPSKYSDYIGEVTYLGEEKPRILNHNYYAETFAPEEEKVMPMIFVVNDALLDSEAMYLEINPTGAVIDNPDYDIRRYIVLN